MAGDIYKGWYISHSSARPITGTWRATRHGVSICAGDEVALRKMIDTRAAGERLEYLRAELRAERISYGELAELQGLAPFIDKDDVELLEAAGVPEHPEAS